MINYFFRFLLIILFFITISSCDDLNKAKEISLNITGVDYAGTGIDIYSVEDTNDLSNKGGGFSITPYSADGVQCCFKVPEKWQPGLKVNVLVRYPLDGETSDEIVASLERREADGTLVDTIPAEIPEYKTPARGTLWVQFLPDKKVRLVVSDLDPSHKNFPSEIKGWPVPSDEFYNKKIMQLIELNNDDLQSFEKAIQENDGTSEKIDEYKRHIENIKEENKKYRSLLR